MSNHSRWTVGEIAKVTGGRISPALSPDKLIGEFFVRAWSCRKTSFVVPLSVKEEDRVMMAKMAVTKRKAIGGILERVSGLDDSFPYIQVPDLQQAARKLAQHSRDAFKGKLVGVTGSAGKSTTTAMLAAALQSQGSTWSTLNNNNLTPHVTANVMSLPEDNDYAVMELALSVDYRVSVSSSIVRPHVAVITSIGKGHIEAFIDQDDPEQCVINEKLSIIDSVVDGGVVVLPSDSPHFEQMHAYAAKAPNVSRIIICGQRPEDDIRFVSTESLLAGERVTLAAGGEQITIDIPFIGPHMHSNLLLAAGVIKGLNLPLSTLHSVSKTKQTMNSLLLYKARFKHKEVMIFNDSGNSTDQNVKAHCAMAAARPGRKLFIVADVPRLAELGDSIHAELLPHIDAAGFEHVITVGPHFSAVSTGLKTPHSSYMNRFHALKRMGELLQDGDMVFIKGNSVSKFKDIMKLIGKKAELKKITGTAEQMTTVS